METQRFFIRVFLIAVTYACVIFSAKIHYTNTLMQNALVCSSDKCLNTASDIIARLNRTVDPCDNFYKFACGGWLQKTQLNRSDSYVSVLTEFADQISKKQLRELLEGPPKESDTKSFRKAKQIYAQCLTNDVTDATYRKTNYSAILYKYVEWPLLMPYRNWDDNHLSWQVVMNNLHKMGFQNDLFDIQLVSDIWYSNSNVIFISEPVFFYSRDDTLQLNNNKTEKERYISLITTIASDLLKEISSTVDEETLTQHAEEIVDFEIELASLTIQDDISDYTSLIIQQLQENYDLQFPSEKGMIDWLGTIQSVFASERIAIGPSEKLYVQAYNYLTNLVPLLERTPSRTIVNYLIWKLIALVYLHFKNEEPSDSQIAGLEERNWWITCATQYNLIGAISHEYVKQYLSHDTIDNINEMITDGQNILTEYIESSWIEEPKKKAFLEKLAYVRHKYVTPDFFDSDEAIDRYYENVDVSTNYLDTVINVILFQRKKMTSMLRTRGIILDWEIDLTSLNSYYNKISRQIVIPATSWMLQTSIHDRNRFEFMNYGSLGFNIRYNMYKALIDNIIKFYGHRKILSVLSLPINDSEITQCFIDQYRKYPFPGLEHINTSVNREELFKENIITSAAIAATYYAYKKKKEYEWKLQGLEQYNNDQMFFIAYAQMLCEYLPPEELEEYTEDIYILNEIMVRGTLSNFPVFSAVYNCSVGKPMNPETKCAFWW